MYFYELRNSNWKVFKCLVKQMFFEIPLAAYSFRHDFSFYNYLECRVLYRPRPLFSFILFLSFYVLLFSVVLQVDCFHVLRKSDPPFVPAAILIKQGLASFVCLCYPSSMLLCVDWWDHRWWIVCVCVGIRVWVVLLFHLLNCMHSLAFLPSRS